MNWVGALSELAQLITAIAVAYNVYQTWHVKKNVTKIEERASKDDTDEGPQEKEGPGQ